MASGGLRAAFRRWAWNKSGFNQYGLRANDILFESPAVIEALRRLPQHVQDDRQFRISRALQLSMTKTILPKEQWTKYEEDDYYLKPYLEEVENEIAEVKEWATK